MSVIVVNAASWPNFVTLVRKEALDLYAEASGVEFWDASPFATTGLDEHDFALWGHWPKRLGASPIRVSGEIIDRIRHLSADRIEHLSIIMVFDTVEHAATAPVGDVARGSPSRAIVDEVTQKIHSNYDLGNELRRVTWIAALRAGGDDEAAWAAAFGVAGPGRVGQGPLFDVAVFLDRRRLPGNRDEGDSRSLTALRVLVDLARDPEAARALLDLSDASREGRVLVITSPRPRRSPAEDLRRRLVTHLDYALRTSDRTIQDAESQPIAAVVDEVRKRVDQTTIGKAVSEAARSVDKPTDEWAPTQQLEELWDVPVPPDDPAWHDLQATNAAETLFQKMTTGVDSYRVTRAARLDEQRKALDDQVRKDRDELRERVEAACVDPSFGLDQKFAGRLDEERQRLVRRLAERSAEATRHRSRRLALLAAEDTRPAAEKLRSLYHALLDAVDRWLPPKIVIFAAAALGGAVLMLGWALLLAPIRVGWWPLLVCGWIVLVACIGWTFVYWFRRRLEQAREEAKAALLEAKDSEVKRIQRVSEHGLAQVVSARIAGAVLPFIETLRRHARAYDKLRDAMDGVEKTLRAGLPQSASRDDRATSHAMSDATSVGGDVPQRFRALLWRATPAPLSPATVTFTDARGDLVFKSSLDLPEPVEVQIPKPPMRPRPTATPVPQPDDVTHRAPTAARGTP